MSAAYTYVTRRVGGRRKFSLANEDRPSRNVKIINYSSEDLYVFDHIKVPKDGGTEIFRDFSGNGHDTTYYWYVFRTNPGTEDVVISFQQDTE